MRDVKYIEHVGKENGVFFHLIMIASQVGRVYPHYFPCPQSHPTAPPENVFRQGSKGVGKTISI